MCLSSAYTRHYIIYIPIMTMYKIITDKFSKPAIFEHFRILYIPTTKWFVKIFSRVFLVRWRFCMAFLILFIYQFRLALYLLVNILWWIAVGVYFMSLYACFINDWIGKIKFKKKWKNDVFRYVNIYWYR